MPQRGLDSVTVPGAVAGWAALHARFGVLPWKELFRPAIYFAQNGFPVTEFVAAWWQDNAAVLEQYHAALFLPGGKAPVVGQIFRNPELARTLQLIADQGPDAFYKGAIAKGILSTSDKAVGVMTAADLAAWQPEWVEPISTTYHGWSVYELPPNVQGMAALEMLNIMEPFPLAQDGFDSPRTFHVKMAAQQLAYADLNKYLADPRLAQVPVKGIISKQYAAERARAIDPAKANCSVGAGDPVPFGGETTYLTAIDRHGNQIIALARNSNQAVAFALRTGDFPFTRQAL